MRLSYSEDSDVLFVTFRKASLQDDVTYSENDNGDIFRLNPYTGEVWSITIPLFMYRLRNGESIDIPELGNTPLSSLLASMVQWRSDSAKHHH